jgi:hypothetical protein
MTVYWHSSQKIQAILGAFSDVTPLEEAERLLHRAREELRVLEHGACTSEEARLFFANRMGEFLGKEVAARERQFAQLKTAFKGQELLERVGPLRQKIARIKNQRATYPLQREDQEALMRLDERVLEAIEEASFLCPPCSSPLSVRLRAVRGEEAEALCREIVRTAANRERLNAALIALGRKEGRAIEGWDQQWGLYHAHESPLRLAQALDLLFAEDLMDLQRRLSDASSPHIARKILYTSPLIKEYADVHAERLLGVARRLSQFEESRQRFSLSSDFCARWRAAEYFLLLAHDQPERADRFLAAVRAILESAPSSQKDQELLLRVAFALFVPHSYRDDLKGTERLKGLYQRAKALTRRGQIQVEELLYGKMALVREGERIVAKYKPNHAGAAAREALGYACTAALGLPFTPPTIMARLSVRQEISELARLLRYSVKDRQGIEQRFAELPQAVQNGVCDCLCRLKTTRSQEGLGEALWRDGKAASDLERARALETYLDTQLFRRFETEHPLADVDARGSLQLWIGGITQRILELLTEDGSGGTHLKGLSPVLVQLYALAGIIKGSRDGSSGNTLATFTDGALDALYEFDDECSLPTDDDFSHLRMWQFGLPQADLPFSRAVLHLFSQPEVLQRVKALGGSPDCAFVPSEALQKQQERVQRLGRLFQEELRKESPTLTPRALFFQLFGGEESYRAERGRGLYPWHIFEFCLGEVGRGYYFSHDPDKQAAITRNLETLHS